jgi:hypothetical protein
MNLVLMSPMTVSIFKPVPTDKELAALHDRKAQKTAALKETMRSLMTNACKTLTALPPEERIVMEAFLFNYNWEQSRGLPRRIVLTAYKQKLLDAVARHATPAEMAALFEEEEL